MALGRPCGATDLGNLPGLDIDVAHDTTGNPFARLEDGDDRTIAQAIRTIVAAAR